MKRFVYFTLSNGKSVYLDSTKIGAVKEIKINDTDAKTMIYLSNGCGMDPYPVKEDINAVMYAIDTIENPEFYKETCNSNKNKGKPESPVINPDTKIGSLTLKDVLIGIRNVCSQIKDCQYCPFSDIDDCANNYCIFFRTYPSDWEIERMRGVKKE